MGDEIPVFLLKARSSEDDAYEEAFSVRPSRHHFEPIFVPVIEHKLLEAGLDTLRTLLRQKKIGNGEDAAYHGLIFTSQRAVEAFAQLIIEGGVDGSDHGTHAAYLREVPIYSVGPATTRALHTIPVTGSLNILGSDSGNGEKLAHFILHHYQSSHSNGHPVRPLLFIVGERRREIIPKILMDPILGTKRIPVVELEVYTTSVREAFEQDFIHHLDQTQSRPLRWVVVFSPTGSDLMLRTLRLLDPTTGKARVRDAENTQRILFATIGPTTRDYLQSTFSFVPDVCAAKPTSNSILEGITKFLAREK